uniref:non-specific serine/threonine protein kinase n=2 Tax=Caenorhabditis tropicalis TaxID=1561998 RepID=A0A1I7U3E7_9PELO
MNRYLSAIFVLDDLDQIICDTFGEMMIRLVRNASIIVNCSDHIDLIDSQNKMPSEKEEDPMKNVTFNEGKKFGDWRLGKVLDEGGFGKVYIATNIHDPNKVAALKAESNEIEGGSAIKLEAMILNKLNENGPAPHIPVVYLCAKRKLYCYMVMTLLGRNLRKLKSSWNGTTNSFFTRGTWSRIGIQCLYAVKFVHDNGFIHRDIKPQNFLLGNEREPERARIVHILDFGLARPFATYVAREKKWIARKARGTAEFRGTLRYTSPNVHLRKEQGRGDDVWSLIYVLIELNGGQALPWQADSQREHVEQKKLNLPPKVVMSNMPQCMDKVIPHLATLDYYQRPDYLFVFLVLKLSECIFYFRLVFKSLWQVMENEKVTPSSKYDWETEIPDKSVPPASWENPSGAFFQTDPLGINGPPTAAEAALTEKSGKNKKTQKK